MTEELEIKQIPVDALSYLKGTRYGLMAAREVISGDIDKKKVTELIIEVSKQITNMGKNKNV